MAHFRCLACTGAIPLSLFLFFFDRHHLVAGWCRSREAPAGAPGEPSRRAVRVNHTAKGRSPGKGGGPGRVISPARRSSPARDATNDPPATEAAATDPATGNPSRTENFPWLFCLMVFFAG